MSGFTTPPRRPGNITPGAPSPNQSSDVSLELSVSQVIPPFPCNLLDAFDDIVDAEDDIVDAEDDTVDYYYGEEDDTPTICPDDDDIWQEHSDDE